MSIFGFIDDIHVAEYELIFSHANEVRMGKGWYLIELPSKRKSQLFQTRDKALVALEEDTLDFGWPKTGGVATQAM